jgi:2-polyprenyl-3-methyl-5-hydroxy-6-metoxy-1,4-benzoquinol methylase
MFQQFKTRAAGTEIMDDFSYTGDDLQKALREIAWVNRWLGGRKSVRRSVEETLRRNVVDSSGPLRIVDLGCGSGDYLRTLADWGRKKGLDLHITGVDANPAIIGFAREQAAGYQNIRYLCADILADSFDLSGYDLVLCGLFLHHLEESEQAAIFQKCRTAGVRAVVVTDLHRHWLAYYLFRLICTVLNFSPMSKHDGALSIRKGFQRNDLVRLMQRCGIDRYDLRWKWAFRYQLIVYLNS